MRKFLKYSFLSISWLLILITAIIVLALGIIQTKVFREKLVSFIEKKAPDYINGSLTIGKIEGDFFTHLVLSDVLLLNASDTILYVPRLETSYNLLPLMHRRVNIEDLKISSLYVNLKQINDSTWNVQQILKPSEPETANKDTISTGKSMDVYLSSFEIIDGMVNIHSSDTIIPKQFKKINTKASFSMADNQIRVQMKNFSLLTADPILELKELKFKLEQDPNSIRINDFLLETAKNRMEGGAEYFHDRKKRSTVVIKTTPLHLDEFNYYLSGFKTPAVPVVSLQGSMQYDSIKTVLDLSDKDQNIHLQALLPNLYRWLTVKPDSLLKYKIIGKVRNVQISRWMDMPNLKYILNGDFSADGKGTEPKTAEIKLRGDLNNLVIEDRKVNQIRMDIGYNKGDADGNVQGSGNFGDFELTADAKNLLKDPLYQFELITRNLDIAPLTGIDTMNSAINMTADVKGRGFDPKSLLLNAAVDISGSRIQKIDVEAMKAFVQYQKRNINIDSLRLQTKTLLLKAQGNYSLKTASDLALTADLKNMDEFSSLLPLKDLQTGGHLDAHLTGNPDSLSLEANLNLPHTQYGEYLLGPVILSAQAEITPEDTIMNAHLLVKDLSSGDIKLDSASFTIKAVRDSADIIGHLINKDLDTHFQTMLDFGELMKIKVSELAVNYKNQKWQLDQSPAVFEISPKGYKITNFSFSNTRGDSIQSVTAEGNITRQGSENFSLNVENIDLKRLLELTDQKLAASGTLNLNIGLNGTSGAPLMKGDFAVNNAVFNNFPFAELGGVFNYKADRMDLGMKILPRDSGKFELSGSMPLNLNLDSMSFHVNKKDSVNLTLTVDKFPLAAIKTIDIIKQITGYIQGEVQMRGNIESPDLKGNLQLKKASVKVPEYGIAYNDILLNVNFLKDKLRLDTLRIRTDKGNMTGNGEVNFSSDFYKGDLKNSELKLNFNGFKPINHKEVNMEVKGSSSLIGTKGNLDFKGNMEVVKSEIYLPALFNMLGKTSTPEIPEPLLIQAMDSTKGKLDTIVVNKKDTAKSDTAKTDYFKNLKGKLRLKIPRNSWIKNENMYVEVSGDLELIKEQQFFELFGNVDVIRGQYELLGRKFVIDKGTLNFQGGEEMMPDMSIQASYNFRNTQGVTQKLSVDIQGFPDSLAVNFTLDNNSINEGDALSYLLFGKSMNELTLDQQQGVAGSSGSMAEQVAASLVSSQLTKFLGSKLNVDYLEIKSEGGFENASLTVGKYITKDLFASYEQQFGQTDIKGIPSYQLNLEYQILKFLSLRMNNSSIDNGFDVIFKFQGK
jgi:translocation and assembly module TamB